MDITSRIFRTSIFSCKWFTSELLSQSRKLNKWGGGGRGVLIRAGGLENFWKKNKRVGTLIRDPRVDLWRASTAEKIKLLFKDTHREKASSNKTAAFTKSMNMDIWVVLRGS